MRNYHEEIGLVIAQAVGHRDDWTVFDEQIHDIAWQAQEELERLRGTLHGAHVRSMAAVMDDMDTMRSEIRDLRLALSDLIGLERTITPDMNGKHRTWAYMQTGEALARCLDRARDVLNRKA